jgi:homogentisate 1,2-dioxygenase
MPLNNAPPSASTSIADTGSTNTFVTVDFLITNHRIAHNPFSIKVPSGHTMTTTHEADIIRDALRPAVRKAHIVPGLAHKCSLLSIGTLCDANYTVTFH